MIRKNGNESDMKNFSKDFFSFQTFNIYHICPKRIVY